MFEAFQAGAARERRCHALLCARTSFAIGSRAAWVRMARRSQRSFLNHLRGMRDACAST